MRSEYCQDGNRNVSEISVKGVLTPLTVHIALLDSRARIIYVNGIWARFAAANVSPETNAYVSVDTLSVCEETARRGDKTAAMACADCALYEAKRGGGNRPTIFSPRIR